MMRPEAAAEVAVLPGMIQVIVDVVATGVMPDPLSIGMDMRLLGMPRLIAVVTVLRRRMRRAGGRGTVFRDIVAGLVLFRLTSLMLLMLSDFVLVRLGERGKSEDQRN
jgi:hypothetical protein